MEANNLFSVIVAIVSAVGGIVMTYLTVVYKKRADRRRAPKDRVEAALDIYEAIMRDMRAVNDAQFKQLEMTGVQLQAAATENERLRGVITDLQRQLKESADQMTRLEAQMIDLRAVVN